MSFPLVKDSRKNENEKRTNSEDSEKRVVCEKKSKRPQYQDMVCLSNLEEIVFFTSTSRCLLDEMKDVTSKSAVEYDKYLDFFE